MSKNQVIGLKTLDLRGAVAIKSTPQRPHKKRVFTDEEMARLHSWTIEQLEAALRKGDFIIRLLSSPEMMNMNSKQADMISSNLRFQQDVIREIIAKKERHHG